MKIAITGANGFLARHLRKALLADGHQVVAIVRPGPSASEQCWPIGLDSATRLAEALSGCQAVAHCAGIAREVGANTFEVVHVEGTRNLLAACRQAKVSKFLLTSFLRARANCGSAYHESKWEAEQMVRASGLDFTIFKAGLLYGERDQVTTRLGAMLERLPFFAGFGFSDPKVRPIAVTDMVALMLTALVDPRLKEKTVPVVGPDQTLTLNQMVKLLGRSRGVDPKVIPLPIFCHRLLAFASERMFSNPLVTSAQIQMLSEGMAQASPPFDPLPEDLAPATPFLSNAVD